MSSKKPANGRKSVPGSAGQKRPAPSTPHSAARKKSKPQPPQSAPAHPQPVIHSSSDDDSDDEEAIRRLKEAAAAKAAAAAQAAEDDEDDFEVAPGSGDEEEQEAGADSGARPGPPSDLDDSSEDETMREEEESEEEEKPKAKKQAPTPAKKAAPAAQPTPAKPTPSAKPTPAKSSPALKLTPVPAHAASVKKQPLPSKQQDSSSESSSSDSETSDSETSDSEDEAPAAKPAPAKPAPVKPAPSAAPTAKAAAKAKPSKVLLDDSSESSDDDDDDTPPPAFSKPQPPRKPTPLQGDASVNPPPKAPKPTAAASSSFAKPLSRPAPAPHTGRAFTVSIALPGSIIANAQSKELRTYVAGQIARAAATFNVDEIVVFAESGKQSHGGIRGNFEGATRSTDPDVFLARILQYLETPQYLRKQLFPKHADLVHAGLLNPLDSPHHVRADEEAPYREGVVLNRPVSAKQRGPNGACWANVGLKAEALVDRQIEPGTRLTVHIPEPQGSTTRKHLTGHAVAPSTPREKHGTYWGYTTRLAQNLSQVWSECPFKGGYDLSIGTSEHGEDCHAHSFELPAFKHVIIFFGGLAGLEEHIAADESLTVKQPKDMFQLYINSVIGQGCRTIRTEEAIPITLAALYRHIRTNQPPQ